MAKKNARETLDEIGIRFGTDKSSIGHDYLKHYELILSDLKNEKFDLLEIGVGSGSSIRLWHEHFPKARIVGVDPADIALKTRLDRFVFRQGNQGDLFFLSQLAAEYRFRVVIDDGSHLWGYQIFSFETLFPSVQSSGFYICEDLHTSYIPDYSGGAMESAMQYFLRLTEVVTGSEWSGLSEQKDPRLFAIAQRIARITFIPHAVVIQAK